MFLDSTTRKLQIVLTSAVTTLNMPVLVDWVDITATTTTPGLTPTNTNGTTLVDILPAPAASTQRKVNGITIYNYDTAAKVVRVFLNDNGTSYQILDVTLQIDDTLGYTDTGGWYTQDANGNRKTIAATTKTAPTQQIFLSGSGTYTTPANVLFITVMMVGGGGGGWGGGSATGTTPTAGTATTFGTALLSAGAGGIGATYNGIGGVAGSSSVGSAVGIALTGSPGGGSVYTGAVFAGGGAGGASALGGAGGSGAGGGLGGSAAANTGGGGGGGGVSGAVGNGGAAGGSGGYIEALITSPTGSYPYSVGTAGAAGGAGTSGYSGGAAGSGLIVVREFY